MRTHTESGPGGSGVLAAVSSSPPNIGFLLLPAVAHRLGWRRRFLLACRRLGGTSPSTAGHGPVWEVVLEAALRMADEALWTGAPSGSGGLLGATGEPPSRLPTRLASRGPIVVDRLVPGVSAWRLQGVRAGDALHLQEVIPDGVQEPAWHGALALAASHRGAVE